MHVNKFGIIMQQQEKNNVLHINITKHCCYVWQTLANVTQFSQLPTTTTKLVCLTYELHVLTTQPALQLHYYILSRTLCSSN